MTLTPEQLIIISIVTVLIVQLLKLFAALRWGWATNRITITWLCAIVAFFLAVFFVPPALPAWPVLVWTSPLLALLAILTYLGQWLVLLSALIGFAKIIYDILLKAVFDKYGFSDNEALAAHDRALNV